MQIQHLTGCPQTIPQVASWLHSEWGQFIPGASVERGILRLEQRLQ